MREADRLVEVIRDDDDGDDWVIGVVGIVILSSL